MRKRDRQRQSLASGRTAARACSTLWLSVSLSLFLHLHLLLLLNLRERLSLLQHEQQSSSPSRSPSWPGCLGEAACPWTWDTRAGLCVLVKKLPRRPLTPNQARLQNRPPLIGPNQSVVSEQLRIYSLLQEYVFELMKTREHDPGSWRQARSDLCMAHGLQPVSSDSRE